MAPQSTSLSNPNPIPELAKKLLESKSVILSTHRNSDGDGLGAQLALFHGLRQLGKKVAIVNLDRPGKKYAFLNIEKWLEVADDISWPNADIALILDTNDRRLVEPLFSNLLMKCGVVSFIDHHPILQQGPRPTYASHIDVSAASTGEIVWRLLREMRVELNAEIARALYTSVVFDTHNFRYVKSNPNSHIMAAELLRFEKDPEEVHRKLFSRYTIEKMAFLARSLSEVEYLADGRVAYIAVDVRHANANGLDPDESADVIDLVMNIETVEAAALVREDAPGQFKISLRSKGGVQVLPLAEKLGGGGHAFAAGAYISGENVEIREKILGELISILGPADSFSRSARG